MEGQIGEDGRGAQVQRRGVDERSKGEERETEEEQESANGHALLASDSMEC